MAVVIQIGGTDKHVRANSLSFTRTTRETGSASCELRGIEGVRSGGEHFRVWESGGQSAWGGTIDQVSSTRLRPGSNEEYYRLSCVSWEQRLTKRRCGSKVYKAETAAQRIIDLATAAGEGLIIDPLNITPTATAEQLGVRTYLGMSVAEAIDDICQVGKDTWFVSPGAYLFSKPRNASVASSLIFSNANKNFFDPIIEEDRVDYYNRIRLAIAFIAFNPMPFEIVGNGVLHEWTLMSGGVEIAIDNIISSELNGVEFTMETWEPGTEADWSYEYGTGKIRQHIDLPVLTASDTVSITLYVIGQNIVTVEDETDIAARQVIEDDDVIDATGIYEGWFEDLNIITQEAGQSRAAALLKDHNPHQNGAPAGALPRKYIFKARGYIPNAWQLQPGFTVQYSNVSPSTGGMKTLLIESVSARQIGAHDPVGDPTGGWLEYTVSCIDYVESTTAGEYFVSLGANVAQGKQGNVSVTAGEEIVTPAGPVTSPEVTTVYVLKEGRWVRQLHCKAVRPLPLGSFESLMIYLEEPDLSSGPPANLLGDGSGDWDGTSSVTDQGWDVVPKGRAKYVADGQVVIIDDLLPVSVPIQGRIYFNSVNTNGDENGLVRAYLPGATPSAVYVSTPPSTGTITGGLGEEYCPTVLSFTADGIQPKYYSQSGGDPLWGASFNVTYRHDDVRAPRLGGVRLYIRYPEGNEENDSTHGLLSKIDSKQDHAVRPVGFTVRVLCVSVDKDGFPNRIASNTPYVDLFISPPIGPTGREYSGMVLNLSMTGSPQYVKNADGQRVLQIKGHFDIDVADPRAATGRVMLLRGGGHEVLLENCPPGDFTGEVVGFPIVDEPGTYLYVLSINTNGWFNSFVGLDDPETPEDDRTPIVGPFILPKPPLGIYGRERAPLATGLTKKTNAGFEAGIKYNYQTGGDPTYRIGFYWDEVTSSDQPETGGYDVIFRYPDGRIGQIAHSAINDLSEWISPEYPLTGAGTFDVLLVTWDVNGRLNDHTAPDTPKLTFSVGYSMGPAGEEWAKRVTSVTMTGSPVYVKTADGQRVLRISGTFALDATDPRSASGRVMLLRNGGHDVLLEKAPPGVFTGEIPGFPIIDEPNTFLYVLTISTNGWINSWQATGALATPRVGPFILPKPPLGTEGQERAPFATGFAKMTTGGFVDGVKYNWQTGGDPTYRVGVLWNAVTSSDQPETGGYDIVFKYPDGRVGQVAQKSIIDAAEWISPEYPFTTSGSFDILLVTRDVNNRLNSHTAPGVPKVTINIVYTNQPPAAGLGSEWTSNLTAFDAGTPVTSLFDQGGQSPVTRVLLTVAQPNVAGYAGWYAYGISPSGVHILMSGLILTNTHTVEFPFVPAVNESWTLYGLTEDVNQRRNSYNATTTLKETVVLGPIALGSAGLEYCNKVTVSFTFETRTTIDGIWQYRYKAAWTAPSDMRWGSVKLMEFFQTGLNVFTKTSPTELAHWHQNDEGTTYTDWREANVATTATTYATAYMVSVDVNGNENSYVYSITPAINNCNITHGIGALNFKRANTTTFNTSEFSFDGSGLFQMNNLSVDKLKVGSILKVGGGPTAKPGQIGVFDESDILIAWMGKQAKVTPVGQFWYGIWGQIGAFGGTSPADANIKFTSTACDITGATFKLTLNNVETSIMNQVDAAYGAYVGLNVKASPGNSRSVMTAGGVACINSENLRAIDLYADSSTMHGKLRVYKRTSPSAVSLVISLNGDDGSVNAEHYNVGASTGVSGFFTSGAGKTVIVTEGIVTYIQP